MKKTVLLKSVFILSLLSIVGKGIGFIREIAMASFYGTTLVADAYLMSGSIATVLTGLLNAICLIYTPIYYEQKDNEERERVTGGFLFLIGIIGLTMIGIGYVFRKFIVHMFAGGFSAQAKGLTEYFYLFALITGLLSVINQLFIFNHNNKGEFVRAAASNLIISTVQIIFIYYSYSFKSLFILNISQGLAMIVQLFFLYYYYRKDGSKIRISFDYMWFKKILLLSLPIILTVAIEEINSLIDRIFASHLQEGTVAALNYAHLLKQMLFFVTVTALSTVLFPSIARLIQVDRKKELRVILEGVVKGLIIILLPITLGCVLYSDIIIKIVYERGVFTVQSALLTSQSFCMYVLALLPLAIREIFIKVFVAFKDVKTNFYISVITVAINILCNFLLYKKLAHMGLALSTALSGYCSIFLYQFLIRKKHIQNFTLHLPIFLFKMLTISISSLLLPYAYWIQGSRSNYLEFVVLVLFTITIYLLLLTFIRKEIKGIFICLKLV